MGREFDGVLGDGVDGKCGILSGRTSMFHID